jgi:prepilin-type N-terminal cleavage/methylation domain-containing protein
MNYIKSNNKWAHQRGTTLVELSVVIAIILLLVSVLFISIDGWKKGADRAACIVNLSTLQKAVRSYENTNMDTLTGGGALTWKLTDLNTAGFVATAAGPICPATGLGYKQGTPANPDAYGFPGQGDVAYTCQFTGNPTHVPQNTANW